MPEFIDGKFYDDDGKELTRDELISLGVKFFSKCAACNRPRDNWKAHPSLCPVCLVNQTEANKTVVPECICKTELLTREHPEWPEYYTGNSFRKTTYRSDCPQHGPLMGAGSTIVDTEYIEPVAIPRCRFVSKREWGIGPAEPWRTCQACGQSKAQHELPSCTSILIIAGALCPCDLNMPHEGWGHSNKEAQAIWI